MINRHTAVRSTYEQRPRCTGPVSPLLSNSRSWCHYYYQLHTTTSPSPQLKFHTATSHSPLCPIQVKDVGKDQNTEQNAKSTQERAWQPGETPQSLTSNKILGQLQRVPSLFFPRAPGNSNSCRNQITGGSSRPQTRSLLSHLTRARKRSPLLLHIPAI